MPSGEPKHASIHDGRSATPSRGEWSSYQCALSALPCSLLALDGNLDVIAVTRQYLLQHQVEESGVLGKSVADRLPSEVLEQADLLPRMRAMAACGGEYEVQGVRQRRDGADDRYLDLRACGVPGAHEGVAQPPGKWPAVLVTVEDVTDREQVREQVRVLQKTATVGQLASGIAHDFSNILAVVIGYADLLLMGGDSGDLGKEELQEIRDAAERGADLTGRLLRFCRQQRREGKVVDLNDVIRGLKGMLSRVLEEEIEFCVAPSAEPALVKADPVQLEQVIMNLIANARDAMSDGGQLTVQTSLTEWDRRGPDDPEASRSPYCVALTVTDTGCGMSEEAKRKALQPFFTDKEHPERAGLGLAIVDDVVTRYNGQIRIDSTPGWGTSVGVRLPAAEAGQRRGPAEDDGSKAPHGSGTVLVVEDDGTARQILARMLESLGYTVLQAEAGDEALRVCEQCDDRIRLVLTDLVMPRMNGRELGERLKQRRPDLPILYMSGYDTGRLQTRAEPMDEGSFLAKPMSRHSLATKMREALDQ